MSISGGGPQPRVSFPRTVYVWEDELLEVLPCFEQPKYPPVRADGEVDRME